jgi:hypothetical protein
MSRTSRHLHLNLIEHNLVSLSKPRGRVTDRASQQISLANGTSTLRALPPCRNAPYAKVGPLADGPVSECRIGRGQQVYFNTRELADPNAQAVNRGSTPSARFSVDALD